MAKFLGLITLSKDGAEALLRTGLREHRDFFDHLVQTEGGRMEGMWMSNVGDWDLVVVLDLPEGTPAKGAASTLIRRANGQHAVERWIELVDPADVDQALAASGVPIAT